MPTVYINDQRYLCVGDYATFLLPSVTGQDSNLISGVIEYDWGHWCIGQVSIRDEDRRWIPNLTLISATREVELPTELWSVITDIEVASGFPYERGILIPNCNLPEGEPVWLLVDEEGHYSVYYSASLKYFSVPESEILS